MSGMRVGVMDTALVSRPAVDSLTRANYLAAVANRVDSFWVPDHLNALFPRSIWSPQYCGAARLVPRADASLEPWTMLGHLAARNRLGRLRLGVSVTDTGRRNPAVTAQAAATLHLLTRGRAILGIGRKEKATSPTGWIGRNPSRGSKRHLPQSGRCGTRMAIWLHGIHHSSRCATRCSTFRPIGANGPRSGSPLTVRECCGPPADMAMPGFPRSPTARKTTGNAWRLSGPPPPTPVATRWPPSRRRILGRHRTQPRGGRRRAGLPGSRSAVAHRV
jgi:hypothetical protein